MAPKFEIGQKVTVIPVRGQPLSPRDSDIEQYSGQTGEVTDYYWIRPNTGKVFYIYTVRIGNGHNEVVLHEDELGLYIE